MLIICFVFVLGLRVLHSLCSMICLSTWFCKWANLVSFKALMISTTTYCRWVAWKRTPPIVWPPTPSSSLSFSFSRHPSLAFIVTAIRSSAPLPPPAVGSCDLLPVLQRPVHHPQLRRCPHRRTSPKCLLGLTDHRPSIKPKLGGLSFHLKKGLLIFC
jgi:hypothetical protein